MEPSIINTIVTASPKVNAAIAHAIPINSESARPFFPLLLVLSISISFVLISLTPPSQT